MIGESQPVWLKVMENGAAGEARTKAFLVDRFWVLERSVDIDGADFLIQLRSLRTRFTDSFPPMMGVVQAKYYQNRDTTHYIPCNYVVDGDEKPIKGFFAVLHVGSEDESEMYLLSSADIKKYLSKTSKEPFRYILGRKAIQGRFRVVSRELALGKIEHELLGRSYAEVVWFLDRVNIPYLKLKKGDIEYEYTLPIPNSQAEIAEEFYCSKEKLQEAMYIMNGALSIVDGILTSSNPRWALRELEDLKSRIDEFAYSLREIDLEWGCLKDALVEYEHVLGKLDQLGKRAAFLDISNRIWKGLATKLNNSYDQAEIEQYYYAVLKFDKDDLRFKSIAVNVKNKKVSITGRLCSACISARGVSDNRSKRPLSDILDYLWADLTTKVLLSLGIDACDIY